MKKWIVAPCKNKDIIKQILINRQIDKGQWRSFLNPRFEDLFDPFLIKEIKPALLRIKKAHKNQEIIGVFGDYDADGIPGAALMYQALTKIGFKVIVFIPTREQGYGLNQEGFNYFKKQGVSLVLAIDIGVRNIDEVNYARQIGIEVIIIDHHEMASEKPDCLILNPKQKGDKYPFKELSAAGVAFKFTQALGKIFNQITPAYLKWSLDLVAISTICDMVPLISENRILAKYGLVVLKKTRLLGLRQLYRKASILPEKIDTYSVGFQIGPRLNAPGRMNYINESFNLLVTKDNKEADRLADKLDKINRQRQNELDRVLSEARAKVCQKKLHQKKVIFVEGVDWPQGIVGLVAGKLMEEFGRPVIVCQRKEQTLTGSARSIGSYNILAALDSAQDYLLKYGGHKKAAGLTLESKHLSSLYDQLLKVAEAKLKDDDLIPRIFIDAELTLDDLKLGLLDEIKKLAPFGLGNPRPIFLLKGASVTEPKTIGKENKHLKFMVNHLPAIGFDLGYMLKELNLKNLMDLVFSLDEDNWNGRRVQLKILDLKTTESKKTHGLNRAKK